METPGVFNYVEKRLQDYEPKLSHRQRFRLWRRTRQIKTIRSEHFTERPKHWWKPSERNLARLSLKIMEFHYDDFSKDMQRRSMDYLLYGESYYKKKWDPNG